MFSLGSTNHRFHHSLAVLGLTVQQNSHFPRWCLVSQINKSTTPWSFFVFLGFNKSMIPPLPRFFWGSTVQQINHFLQLNKSTTPELFFLFSLLFPLPFVCFSLGSPQKVNHSRVFFLCFPCFPRLFPPSPLGVVQKTLKPRPRNPSVAPRFGQSSRGQSCRTGCPRRPRRCGARPRPCASASMPLACWDVLGFALPRFFFFSPASSLIFCYFFLFFFFFFPLFFFRFLFFWRWK